MKSAFEWYPKLSHISIFKQGVATKWYLVFLNGYNSPLVLAITAPNSFNWKGVLQYHSRLTGLCDVQPYTASYSYPKAITLHLLKNSHNMYTALMAAKCIIQLAWGIGAMEMTSITLANMIAAVHSIFGGSLMATSIYPLYEAPPPQCLHLKF